jgi:hypothetical protein
MSKKSRRRNRRILGALAALGTGLALANRGKGTEMSNVSVDSGRGSGLRPTVDDKSEIEFKESIVSTPKTIKDSQVLGRMRGSGDQGGFTGQNKRANYATRMRDKRRNDMLRAIRSTQDIFTTPDSILQGIPESALMAKKGGRIVKGKKTAVRKGAAKRGFGRAYKGGK